MSAILAVIPIVVNYEVGITHLFSFKLFFIDNP